MRAFIHAESTDLSSIEVDGATVRGNQTDNHIKTGRFTRAVWA